METNDKNFQATQEPGFTLWAGILPFVLLGIMVLLFEAPREWGNWDFVMTLSGIFMFGGYLVILIGLLAGALAGFPRWVFPYLTYAIVFALYISNASTPGLVVFGIEMWGRDLWGWRACVPLGLVLLLIPLLKRHPLSLLHSLWSGLKNDWSRFGFGLYGLFPLLIFINFDEVDHTYSFPGAMAGVLLIIVGAILYLRLKTPPQRIFGLVAFAFLAILVVSATSDFYWNTHSVNLTTGESHLLEEPVPYAGILWTSLRSAVIAALCLLLPTLIFGFAVHLSKITKEGLPENPT